MAKRLSASQVRRAYRLLCQILASAVDNDLIHVSPCRRRVRLRPLPDPDPRILTVPEFQALAGACEPADRVLVLLLAYGGLRVGEALPLRRRHLDVVGGRVLVKTAVTEVSGGPVIDTPTDHQIRELALPAFVVDLVRELLVALPGDPDAFLFPGRQRHTAGRQQSYHSFRRRFLKAARSVDLGDVTPHDLSGDACQLGGGLARRPGRREPAGALE